MKLFREFVNFVENELLVIPAVEMEIASLYFLSTGIKNDYVQGLMKIQSPNKLLAVWNASWDIFFCRLLHGGYLEQYSGKREVNVINPKLITSDKKLAGIAKGFSIIGMSKEKNAIIPLLGTDVSDIRQEFIDDYISISRHLIETSYDRKLKLVHMQNPFNHFKKIIINL